jgi:hypothetical protein
MPPAAESKKKASKKSVTPEILKQRRDTIEKRIARLEGKLAKDRALLVRYADIKEEEEAGAA